jgi:iron complex outermembrane receptor protein
VGTPPNVTLEPLDDQMYSAEWLADAEVAYRWSRYTFAVGAENIFDQFPDRNKVFRDGTTTFTAQSNNGMFTYPSQSPFGMNGRFVYTRLTYTF